ncbi:hypothetical protein [Piscirickettsia salmonis]|uniref:hypothetical protein n=1 Tax=Piscirickettsia salmonis TaxID=1238 RepID=UPI0012B8B397|nr:hypothetical protein [Piscirickettsia salmonis]QHS33779.1 hypothetical protein GW535_16010 [Piscirickettsia salmonis]QIX56770.1 hypothetical protein GW536_16635 [Piscirickettsia salmonis]
MLSTPWLAAIVANILRLRHLHSTQTAENQTIINDYSATVFRLFGEYCSKKIDNSALRHLKCNTQ